MPPGELDVPTCLDQVRTGDDDAARALVEHFYPRVIRIVRSHLPRRLAEEDLAQEGFLKMFIRLDKYEARDGTPFEPWLARLAVRTCLDALRSERRRPEWRLSDLPLLEGGERDWLDYLSAPEP